MFVIAQSITIIIQAGENDIARHMDEPRPQLGCCQCNSLCALRVDLPKIIALKLKRGMDNHIRPEQIAPLLHSEAITHI